jgi:hypothetical protein
VSQIPEGTFSLLYGKQFGLKEGSRCLFVLCQRWFREVFSPFAKIVPKAKIKLCCPDNEQHEKAEG